MMIAPAMKPPAIPPFWSFVKPPDVDGEEVGVGVGVAGGALEEVVLVLADVVVEAVVEAVVLSIAMGVAVALAPTPPNAAPGVFYDHKMTHFSVWQRVRSGSAIPGARWSTPLPLRQNCRRSRLHRQVAH